MCESIASAQTSSSIDTAVWYLADNIYDSLDTGVVGAQQAGNVSQAGGALQIAVRKETVQCLPTQGGTPVTQEYTIGSIYTRTFNFTYGEVEVRAKMTGPGTWPAAWLIDARCQSTYWIVVPAPNWATGWEIDFAEYKPGASGGSVHKIWQNHKSDTGNWYTHEAEVADVTQWHTYRVEWSPGLLVYKIDGVETHRATAEVPDSAMFLCLGYTGLMGEAGGELDDSTLPQTMYVDYARVTQHDTVIFEDNFGGTCRLP